MEGVPSGFLIFHEHRCKTVAVKIKRRYKTRQSTNFRRIAYSTEETVRKRGEGRLTLANGVPIPHCAIIARSV
jgi:hypothetical protein